MIVFGQLPQNMENIIMTETMPISEFKATFLKVIDQVKNTGVPIIVTKRGEPYALVSPPPEPKKVKSLIGKYENEIKNSGDIVAPDSCQTEWNVLK